MPPRLLLHCCCAPCATHVLEVLSRDYKVTAFFYNPNIKPRAEHDLRAAELEQLLTVAEHFERVDLILYDYLPEDFDNAAAPYLTEPEHGLRCTNCFQLRLGKVAERAKKDGFDYFATTLSVSPHKNATLLNEIGIRLAELVGVRYLISDFKKRDGYKRSVELSKIYGLYRQKYCGCTER